MFTFSHISECRGQGHFGDLIWECTVLKVIKMSFFLRSTLRVKHEENVSKYEWTSFIFYIIFMVYYIEGSKDSCEELKCKFEIWDKKLNLMWSHLNTLKRRPLFVNIIQIHVSLYIFTYCKINLLNLHRSGKIRYNF